jgi:hypothetical protein
MTLPDLLSLLDRQLAVTDFRNPLP